AHAGSTPREAGTSMLVTPETTQGTIGGGALEHQAIARARAMLMDGQMVRLDRQALGPALAQCCGGSVTLLTEVFEAEALRGLPESGLYARPTTNEPTAQPLAIQRALRDARSGQPVGPILTGGWFAEPVEAPHAPLWIYGAGHVGRALVATLQGLPVQITWVDDARARFPKQIPAHALMLVAQSPTEAARHAPAHADHLVLTYSHALDLALCHQILSQPHASLGLIGSATKRARFTKRLAELGHSPQTIAGMICPIGDPSLGKHPQAIAIGVASRLLTRAPARQSMEHRA
ncbi:MAG: xanthine dehydrogenase accessory protein XdhC, partial [Pseudomonadota bacterium]